MKKNKYLLTAKINHFRGSKNSFGIFLKSKLSDSRANPFISNKLFSGSSRSQMKIMEMSFMILALFLFFVMVGLFFLVSYTSDSINQANLLYRQGTINTLAALSETPEFECGEFNCVDLDKMFKLKEMASTGGIYRDFWSSISSLKIVKVYPYISGEQKCVNNVNDNCNTIIIKQKETGVNEMIDSTFVSICRKEYKDNYVYDKCEIGRIVAGTAEKK